MIRHHENISQSQSELPVILVLLTRHINNEC